MLVVQKATLSKLEAIISLFDAYRTFYEQESNIKGATEFLKQQLTNQ